MNLGFLPPKPDAGASTLEALRQFTREIAQAVRVAMQGGLNVTSEVTLTAGDYYTVLEDPRITVRSFIDFMPLTVSAVGARSLLWVAAQESGKATLLHATDAATDQRFRYVVLG